ncbi:hypothetical protein [Paenibacillus sp. UNC451MF]|uniref:hypothetical protein n=1 Tax=Paenibacillus sp. UNC451MF TaxID=1449063 RepID=UPI000566922F|nr:hypothetical protein [Paenibacillus sp. UNC451MF]
MRVYSKGFILLIGVTFIVCVVEGVMAYQSTSVNSSTNQSHPNPLNYPENEHGQTYGSAQEATTVEMLPDLIHTGSMNGIKGYLLKKDYLGETSRDVPLYDVDGKIIIGSYHIGAKNMSYPKNKNGQTYGSATDAASKEAEPELISAIGVNGTKGYVLKKDIDGELPKSPRKPLRFKAVDRQMVRIFRCMTLMVKP